MHIILAFDGVMKQVEQSEGKEVMAGLIQHQAANLAPVTTQSHILWAVFIFLHTARKNGVLLNAHYCLTFGPLINTQLQTW